MLGFPFASAKHPFAASSPSAAHADDIEIGCGGTLLAATRSLPDVEVTWVVLGAEGEREHEARASAEAFLAAAGSSEVVVRGFRDGYFPYLEAAVKDAVRGAEGPRRARPDLHARARRPPPGSPARLRADVEHVARPRDPRVRDPEVRRRPRLAERLRPARRGCASTRSSGCSASTTRPSAASTGSTTSSSAGSCVSAAWRPHALRGGVHVPEAHAPAA